MCCISLNYPQPLPASQTPRWLTGWPGGQVDEGRKAWVAGGQTHSWSGSLSHSPWFVLLLLGVLGLAEP